MEGNPNLNQAQFFHGTNARLSPGDQLNPGHGSNFGVDEDISFVHVTNSPETAHGYADWAARRAENAKVGVYPSGFSRLDNPDHDFGPTERHVYEVAPTGPVEHDNSTLADQFRTRHPARVVREI